MVLVVEVGVVVEVVVEVVVDVTVDVVVGIFVDEKTKRTVVSKLLSCVISGVVVSSR